MANRYIRLRACAVCGGQVIADFDSEQIYCENPVNVAVHCPAVPLPQWILISAYAKKSWLKQAGYVE
jgi:hypothetical protein